jgi:hypothetical protein
MAEVIGTITSVGAGLDPPAPNGSAPRRARQASPLHLHKGRVSWP